MKISAVMGLAVSAALGGPALAQPAPEFGMGYVREPEEEYQRSTVTPRHRAFLPAQVDLSPRFPRPGSQGKQGSCVGWATGYALRSYHEGRRQDWKFERPDELISPASIFNRLRGYDGKCSEGTSLTRALELLKEEGAHTLRQAPYTPDDCSRRFADALGPGSFRINGWRRIDHTKPDDIKGQLAAGNPVVFGMDVSQSFEKMRGAAIYDDTESPRIGGHAMVLVGYDESRQAFKLINSWGTQWGDKGFGWVSYRALSQLSNRLFVMDVPVPPPVPSVVVAPPKPPEVPVVVAPLQPPAPQVPPAPVVVVPPPASGPVSRPRELIANYASLRAGQLSCASVQSSVSADNTVRLEGFAGSAAEVEALKAELAAIPGVKGVEASVSIRPWPQCEVFMNFAGVIGAADTVKAHVRGGESGVLRGGDALAVEIVTPSYPSYVYVSYLQANGEVAHLTWPVSRGQVIAPGTRLLLGGSAPGAEAQFRIGPPFGQEVIVVVASARPLFGSTLPETPTERDYLTTFRRSFAMAGAGGTVSAAVIPLRTEARR